MKFWLWDIEKKKLNILFVDAIKKRNYGSIGRKLQVPIFDIHNTP